MVLASNKRAFFDYEILERFTAGIVLSGAEVKTIKKGRADMSGAFASIDQGEAWIKNMHVPLYGPARRNYVDYDAEANRKLLLNQKELEHIATKTHEKGISLIPLKLHSNHGLIKVELGLAKGKKKADKRETIKKRDFERNRDRMMKEY